jgi:adiponectin receptor
MLSKYSVQTWTADPSVRSMLLPGLINMFACYGLGFFFFISRVPERFFPGKFDVWLHSHQLWHLCVLGAVYSWFWQIVKYKLILQEQSCFAHGYEYPYETA